VYKQIVPTGVGKDGVKRIIHFRTITVTFCSLSIRNSSGKYFKRIKLLNKSGNVKFIKQIVQKFHSACGRSW